MSNDLNVTTVGSETNLMSPWSILVSIFYEPSRVFRSIKEKSTWLIPLIVFLLVIVVSAYITTPISTTEQIAETKSSTTMTQLQIDQKLAGLEFLLKYPIVGVISFLVGVGIWLFIMVGVIMLMANVILGGKGRFSQVFSMVVVSMLVSIPRALVETPLIIAKNSMHISTSLAILLPGSSVNSILYMMLNGFTNFFVVWQLVLLFLGVRIIYDFSTNKALATILVPTGVAALVAIGIMSIMPR